MLNKFFNIYTFYSYDIYFRFTNFSVLYLFWLKTLNHSNYQKLNNRQILLNLAWKLPTYTNNFNKKRQQLTIRNFQLILKINRNKNLYLTFFISKPQFIKTYLETSFFKKNNFFLNIYFSNVFSQKNIKNLFLFKNINLTGRIFNEFLINNIMSIKTKKFNLKKKISSLVTPSLLKNNNFIQININKILIHLKKKRLLFYKLMKKKTRINKYVTKFFNFFKNFSTNQKLIKYEFTLYNILMNLYLFTKNDLMWLINNNFIYLNKKICQNLNITIKKNDIIQFKLNKYIYLLSYFSVFNFIKIQYKTLKKYQYYLYLKKQNKNIQINMNTKTLYNLIFMNYDVPNYLEMDFITLTCFILYIPINKINWTYHKIKYLNLLYLQLLNWRYLY